MPYAMRPSLNLLFKVGGKKTFAHVELFRLFLDCLYLSFLMFYFFFFFFCLLELRSGGVMFACHTKAS